MPNPGAAWSREFYSTPIASSHCSGLTVKLSTYRTDKSTVARIRTEKNENLDRLCKRIIGHQPCMFYRKHDILSIRLTQPLWRTFVTLSRWSILIREGAKRIWQWWRSFRFKFSSIITIRVSAILKENASKVREGIHNEWLSKDVAHSSCILLDM